MVAHALEELISETDQIMIMGHTNPDIDSMGSSIGIYCLAKALNKSAYIIDSDETNTLQRFLAELLSGLSLY